MTQPTVFVQFESREDYNPVAMALGKIVELNDAVITQRLVTDDEVEADIAVVNRAEAALRAVKETEHTIIILVHYGRDEEAPAIALASRFPKRIKAAGFVAPAGHQENLVVSLLTAIAKIREGK
ncbi:MAG: hypothetical protein ABH846_02025 [Patescibacteria group bacterium]